MYACTDFLSLCVIVNTCKIEVYDSSGCRLDAKTSKVRANIINRINVVLFRALHFGCRCLCRPKSNALKKLFKIVLSAAMFTRFKLCQRGKNNDKNF